MKFICLGYYSEKAWDGMNQAQQEALVDDCLAYDEEVLRKGRHFLSGEALAPSSEARTVRFVDGRVKVMDGPYAEAKEQIGGLMIIEAENLEEAVRLISKHPGVKGGPFEIRPVVDMTPMVEASEARRKAGKGR
jgi:hypothetical protein